MKWKLKEAPRFPPIEAASKSFRQREKERDYNKVKQHKLTLHQTQN